MNLFIIIIIIESNYPVGATCESIMSYRVVEIDLSGAR